MIAIYAVTCLSPQRSVQQKTSQKSFSTTQHGLAWLSTAQHSPAWLSMAQASPAWLSMAQASPAWLSVAQDSPTWLSMAQGTRQCYYVKQIWYLLTLMTSCTVISAVDRTSQLESLTGGQASCRAAWHV